MGANTYIHTKLQCLLAILGGIWSLFSYKKWEGVFISGSLYKNKYRIFMEKYGKLSLNYRQIINFNICFSDK